MNKRVHEGRRQAGQKEVSKKRTLYIDKQLGQVDKTEHIA